MRRIMKADTARQPNPRARASRAGHRARSKIGRLFRRRSKTDSLRCRETSRQPARSSRNIPLTKEIAMRTLAFAALLFTCALMDAGAQDKKKESAKKAEPKVWMCKKGELLWEQHFDGTFPKEWHKGKGDWQFDGDALKGAEIPADKHNTYMSRDITTPNVIVQFSFKIQGCPWMGASVDGKEHVSNLSLQPDQFRISKMTGIGPTTKHTEVDATKLKLSDDP